MNEAIDSGKNQRSWVERWNEKKEQKKTIHNIENRKKGNKNSEFWIQEKYGISHTKKNQMNKKKKGT